MNFFHLPDEELTEENLIKSVKEVLNTALYLSFSKKLDEFDTNKLPKNYDKIIKELLLNDKNEKKEAAHDQLIKNYKKNKYDIIFKNAYGIDLDIVMMKKTVDFVSATNLS